VKLARVVISSACATLLAIGLATWSRAAEPPRDDESRLRARLSPEATQQVLAIVREARDASLPTEPLVARALEGASRGVDATRIATGVRALADALRGARGALGSSASPDEIVAGGNDLLAGVPADTLTRLRATRESGSLVIPLIVLGDLVSRGVPPGPAANAVITASRTGANDRTLLRLRERIHERIEKGGSPERATGDVLRQWLQGPTTGTRSVTTPRSPPPKRPGQP
jgi:hypothetical protein